MNRVHPYAIILGPIIGIMVFFVMRHPPFSLFIGVVATFGLDYFFKSREAAKLANNAVKKQLDKKDDEGA